MIGDVTAVDRLTYGALFAGYGGLELGVQSVLPGVTSWYAEVDPSAARVMAHHHPAVPNLGDVTAVDWATVEPVDVITGGSPCQDLSAAGMREGMRAGTRSGLWVSMCEAVAVIQPRLVVWENVLGAVSAGADSNLEPCPGCVGDADDGPVLRALGRVLGDLASIRYDAWWASVRASDVGAPHRRTRIFLFATPADFPRQEQREPAGSGVWPEPGGRVGGTAVTLLPTPRATDGTKGGPNQRGSSGDLMLPSAVALLPTPKANDHTGAGVHGTGGLDLPTAVLWSLPRDVADTGAWGKYTPAIARWETILGRAAPDPTTPGKNNPQLAARFVEWMMGLPDGWVTGHGLTRAQALKVLGNGVVPQQAAAATRLWGGRP